MANIDQLTTANTFGQWITGSASLVTKMNSLTDGGNNSTFYANTNIEIGNNSSVIISGNLTVTGNITLDTIGFDDINSNGSIYVSIDNNEIAYLLVLMDEIFQRKNDWPLYYYGEKKLRIHTRKIPTAS